MFIPREHKLFSEFNGTFPPPKYVVVNPEHLIEKGYSEEIASLAKYRAEALEGVTKRLADIDSTIGVGFMLENAVEAAAKKHPETRFLLIDSPILDANNKPYTLPNVKSIVFRENEGTFLAGALAGLTIKSGKVGFVGGMEVPLIRKFEAGYKAGVRSVRPDAEIKAVYTGSFDDSSAGKRVAQDLFNQGVDVAFHAAWSDGLGVIQGGYLRLFDGAFGSPAALGETSIKTAVLTCTGLSVGLAYTVGLFNIGAEGQFISGALAAAVVGMIGGMPAPVHITIAL